MTSPIRFATPDDSVAVAAIYDPIVANTSISFEERPPGAGEMRRRIVEAGDTYPWLVYERDGAFAGYAYAGLHRSRAAYRWSVDVSVYVAPTLRRSGVGRALYAELFRTLALQGFYTAFAGVTLPNHASCRLHASVGFTSVGTYHAAGFKFSAWHDTMWFERRLRPLEERPVEPGPCLPTTDGVRPPVETQRTIDDT